MNEIFTSIKRAPYQSLAAFLALFFTSFLLITIIFSLSLLYGLLGYVETRPQVTVYFRTKTAENDVFKARNALISSGKVLSVKYISKDEAFKIYKELNKNNPLLLEMISPDIFPASLEVYAKKPGFLSEIAEFLKTQPGVDEVNFQKIIIERLLSINNIIRKSAFILFGFLLFTTTIILLTLTHFKVALKKDEIELYRFLGASNFYIKKPFLSEAVFFGFTSSALAFLIFGGLLLYLNPFLTSYLSGISNLTINLNFYPLTVWPINLAFIGMVFAVTCLFGIITSTFASFLATQKYIK